MKQINPHDIQPDDVIKVEINDNKEEKTADLFLKNGQKITVDCKREIKDNSTFVSFFYEGKEINVF
jgi:hypothetical protein